MKKVLITSVCAIALAGSAFAQGKLNWQTISASFVTAQTNATVMSSVVGGGASGLQGGTVGSTTATAGQFSYALLFSGTSVPVSGAGVAAPASLASLAGWTESGLTAQNATTAGRLLPNSPGSSVTVPWAAGVTQNVVLVGWSVNLGATWTAALATLNSPSALAAVTGLGFFGVSNTGYLAAGSADPGTSVFGSADGGFGLPIKSLLTQLNLVTPVPEPATIALAGLGGLALLALRRKK